MPNKMNQYLKMHGKPLLARDEAKRDKHKYARDSADMGLPIIGKLDPSEYSFRSDKKQGSFQKSHNNKENSGARTGGYGRYGTEDHSRVEVTSYGSSSRYASTGGFSVNADEWSAEPMFMRMHETNLLDRQLKHDDKVRSDDRDYELKKLDLSHSWGAAREAASYDHNFAMASLRSRTQRELQAKHEHSKTERFLFGNLFQHKNEKARHKANARAGELALARDKARYRHIARENKKAAKRERRRIVVQRGYY